MLLLYENQDHQSLTLTHPLLKTCEMDCGFCLITFEKLKDKNPESKSINSYKFYNLFVCFKVRVEIPLSKSFTFYCRKLFK